MKPQVKTMRHLPALAALFLLSPALQAATQPTPELQALDDALPGNLINDPSRLDWPVFGAEAASKAIKGSAAPGGGALQITSPKRGATLYEIGANAPITAAIAAGQRITVAFYARTVKADTPDGQGIVGVRFQQNVAPYAGFGDSRVSIGTEWKLYEVTAIADRPIAAGQGVVGFQLSGAKQTIEIGQTIVVEGAASIVPKSGAAPAAGGTPLMLPQLAGKGTPVSDLTGANWEFYGDATARKPVPAKGLPGDSATQFIIPAVGKNVFDSGVNVPLADGIEEGDIMLVAVLARTISADTPDGLGRIAVRVQQNSAPYPGFGEHVLSIGPTWKLLQIKTQARLSIAKGQAAVALHLAGAKQVIEVSRVYVLKDVAP